MLLTTLFQTKILATYFYAILNLNLYYTWTEFPSIFGMFYMV